MGRTCQVSIRPGLSVGLPADGAPRAQIRAAPATWLPRDWLLALEMRVISAMTFLFRLDVCACVAVVGMGIGEFSHSVCLPVCAHVYVCAHLFATTCTSLTV